LDTRSETSAGAQMHDHGAGDPIVGPFARAVDNHPAAAILRDALHRARQIIEGLGLEVATPIDAREILSLKGGDKVAF
jgi:hypothetical protein